MTHAEENLTLVEKELLKIIQELFLKQKLTADGEKILAENKMFIKYPSYFSLSTKAAGEHLTKVILEKGKIKNNKNQKKGGNKMNINLLKIQLSIIVMLLFSIIIAFLLFGYVIPKNWPEYGHIMWIWEWLP